jgi:twitching motility protein PilT
MLSGGKPFRKVFKDAPWQSEAEVDDFVREVGRQPAAELIKLLEILIDRGSDTTAAQQRARARAFRALTEAAPDPSLFGPYAKALRQGDNIARQVIATVLPKLNNTAQHGELCEVLGAPEGEARRAAAHVLAQVAGVQAFQQLQKLVGKKDFAGRIEAMDVIVPKAGHRAIPLLGAVLESGTSEEKRRALQHLCDSKRMGKDPTAAQYARGALDDKDERVMCVAIEAYASLVTELEFIEEMSGGLMESTSIPVIRAVMQGLRRYKSAAAVEFMARKIRLGPDAVRMAAIEALEAMAADEAVPPLVEALKHAQVTVRNRAAQALVNMATKREIDLARTIIWLVRSRDGNVRRLAVEIAKKVGDPSGELSPKLLRFLRDEDWWVRERVADALVEMAGPNLTRHVAEYLTDPSDVVRRYAVGFLRRLRDPRALGALVRVLMDDKDWWVREWALEAVADLKDARAIPYVIEMLERDEDLRPACFQALVTLDARDSIESVVPFLSDPNAEVRLAAVKALGDLGGTKVAGTLQMLQSDSDFRVREHVKDLLTRWKAWQQAGTSIQSMTLLDRMLAAVVERGADDLILASDRMPMIKLHGKTVALTEKVFTADQVRALITPLLTTRQLETLGELQDVDFSHEVKTHNLRFRAHVFTQMTGLSAVFRTVKNEIPQLETLGLPEIVSKFADFKNGLVLVGGPTGSGKSTTLAALIDYINRKDSRHIVTLEDPIEVVHTRKESLINQREVGSHTKSFDRGLRATLRQDPDVILVGELRDQSTISMAVTAGETGHLVFATVHTVSADTSIDRVINAFPAAQQPQVRSMLAETLRAVVCQHLLRRRDGNGRVLCSEVMIANDAISNLIRKGKTFQIPSVVSTSKDQGMQTMDAELIRMVKEGIVAPEDAYSKSNDKKAFEAAFANPDKAQPQRAQPQPPAPPGPRRTMSSATTMSGTNPGATRVQGSSQGRGE